jgi:hypothetical protein
MRYAYWRSSKGTPHKSDDGKYAPTALLAEIGTTATVKGTGVSWKGFGLHKYELAAFPNVAIIDPEGNELNESDATALVRNEVTDIIRELGGGKPVLADQLLRRLDKKAAAFYRRPKVQRILVTSLSIKEFPEKVMVESVEISKASRLDFPYPDLLNRFEEKFSPPLSKSRYLTISATTNEVTVNQAVDSGLNAINYLRGVWNHLATFRRFRMSMSSAPKPKWIGDIHIGQVQTLHNTDGSNCDDVYWFQPEHVQDADLFTPPKGWQEIERDREWIWDQVDKSPFKRDLIALFVRYAIALDHANLDVCFLMLWGLL